MIRKLNNLERLINNNFLNISHLYKRKIQKGGYAFMISAKDLNYSNTYEMDLNKICSDYVKNAFTGYINIYVGIHRPDWHNVCTTSWLCNYANSPIKISENRMYNSADNTFLNINLFVRSGSSSPSLRIMDGRMNTDRTIYQVYIEILPSNQLIYDWDDAFPDKKNFNHQMTIMSSDNGGVFLC